jgi:polyhydroxyalkanoate synthesis regulator phasin
MNTLISYLLINISWANVPADTQFNMPFHAPEKKITQDQTKEIADLRQRMDVLERNIRGALSEALNHMEADGSISPRMRSMLNDPTSSLGKIIAYMFERQHVAMKSEIKQLETRITQLQSQIDLLGAELKSLTGRVALKKEKKGDVERRIKASFSKDYPVKAD